ncbi:copper amine oxidase N-terminal domain-containing protein [Solibacillus sp. FSL R7-0668]|uniref:copper amine oxidase N-terminal domain-containing protein n=1 Tax=Solibacillus sp. FSL R7-0668 TaxID=2921688 RepID=UPI0030F869DD
MKKGTTLVPMRAIFEDLGATVEYDKNTKKITAYKDSKIISLTVGNKTAYVTENGTGNSISLSHPAESYKNTTMVPLRFIAESLGAITEWDSVLQQVKITTTK